MQRWLLLVILAVGCAKSKPLPEAILGSWEVLCYTDKPTSSCLSKEKHGLRKMFQPGGALDVRRPDEHQPSSDVMRWAVAGDELTITMTGGGITLVENWRGHPRRSARAVGRRERHRTGARPRRGVTPPCNGYDYGGVLGSSQLVDGVERETSIGTSICLDGTELALMCSTEHTRGHLESEKDAALGLCKTIRR